MAKFKALFTVLLCPCCPRVQKRATKMGVLLAVFEGFSVIKFGVNAVLSAEEITKIVSYHNDLRKEKWNSVLADMAESCYGPTQPMLDVPPMYAQLRMSEMLD
ncbi:hypothetical protein HELRODRAFT_159382 [Helobdella robusta]|uniref:Uncharacterized protein n=1 Tax=Helobdella robusta TaxID=6412 RepID=T1ENZ4_HELRO|nr:hypothetical protein HELRODRAFT_159382 [Helobdella robusta]ESO12798.1 hypothetical protein HELRODRAFT_159382 [Helobdella robusta]